MKYSMQSQHLVQAFRHWRRWLVGSLGLLTALLLYCWWEARLPNETLVFTREVSSKLDASAIAQKLENVAQWKEWLHSVRDVKMLDAQNRPAAESEQHAREGAHLEIQVDPGKGARRRFQFAAQITRFEPGKLVEVRVLDDSSGKTFRVIDQLAWRIEVVSNPSGPGARIIGTQTAHTSHWRSRLLGRIAPRSILNQLFYPNLLVLADPGQSASRSDGVF